MPPLSVRRPSPARVLGVYALAAMERDGPQYGYALSERVADRTQAAWRPGPGAVYPALDSLVRRGCARRVRDGRRTLYRITPRGRALLRGWRRKVLGRTRTGPDLGILWSEIAGYTDRGSFLIDRCEAQLSRVADYLESAPTDHDAHHLDELRVRFRESLRSATERLNGTARPRRETPAPRGSSRKVAA